MASKISVTLNAARGKAPFPPSGSLKRPHAALQDEEDEGRRYGLAEKVSHFDHSAGGAIDDSREKKNEGPMVIPKLVNRDWRDAAEKRKRQKSALPQGGAGGSQDMERQMKDIEAHDAARKPEIGLNLSSKQRKDRDVTDAESEVVEEEDAGSTIDPPRQRTDDELAMAALLGKTTKNHTLTIEQAEPTMSEEDAFQHDYTDAPDMASIDDYARVPVEEFGAALLRGMGWKDGEGIGNQRGKKLSKDVNKLPQRRANLLGIGAKEDAALAQELGAWGNAARRGKEVKIYNPVLLKDKKTGEMYTEEELKKKQERDERAKYEEEFEKKEKQRDRRNGRDGERKRESTGNRDNDSRDRDRNRRNRRDDYESEGEYRRRKEKERWRHREYDDRNGGHDRGHSRRHRDDSERDHRRDRDRDRRR